MSSIENCHKRHVGFRKSVGADDKRSTCLDHNLLFEPQIEQSGEASVETNSA